MKDIKVLLIDTNIDARNAVKKYFSDHASIDISFEADTGFNGLKLIKEHQCDYNLVLLDIVLSRGDGISILEEVKRMGINKRIIVTTSLYNDYIFNKVSSLGVDYIFLKPYNLKDLEERIESLYEESIKKELINEDKELQQRVTKILHGLGVPSHIKGYQFIRDGIILVYNNPEYIGGITKSLYPDIASKNGSTPSRVERAIRHAIDICWNRADWDLMEEIFGNSVDIERAKPTNSEFIVTVADKLRLELNSKNRLK